jgi:hypothetical protein
MTISELIAVLIEARGLHGDVPVLLSSDAEGNRYSPVAPEYSTGFWDDEDFLDPEEHEGGKPYNAIALYPV